MAGHHLDSDQEFFNVLPIRFLSSSSLMVADLIFGNHFF